MGRVFVFLLGLALIAAGAIIFREFLAAIPTGAAHGVKPAPAEFLRPIAAAAAGLLGLTLALAAMIVHRRKAPFKPAPPVQRPAADDPVSGCEPAPFPTDGVIRAFDPEPVDDEEEAPSSEPRV